MRLELEQQGGEWVVLEAGAELARFDNRQSALADVASRLEASDETGPAALALRFSPPGQS